MSRTTHAKDSRSKLIEKYIENVKDVKEFIKNIESSSEYASNSANRMSQANDSAIQYLAKEITKSPEHVPYEAHGDDSTSKMYDRVDADPLTILRNIDDYIVEAKDVYTANPLMIIEFSNFISKQLNELKSYLSYERRKYKTPRDREKE